MDKMFIKIAHLLRFIINQFEKSQKTSICLFVRNFSNSNYLIIFIFSQIESYSQFKRFEQCKIQADFFFAYLYMVR